ncbi:MAG: glycosyltransferase family 2 protein, partial [Deltaproteobacteria bacterium]|nr:glycosyltransferase family 2 protein [Deltaproteobacteria bacterium]
MNSQTPLVSVCIITYNRPEQLQILLESLAEQTMHKQHMVEIIVVDNDANRTAQFVVNDFIARYPHLAVIYEIESMQGIPLARNHSVRLARGQFVAFIDDDEKAEPLWLEALYQC